MKIRWAILTGGEPEPLAGRDLTLEISSGNRVRTTLSFVADGNVAEFVFEGSEQRYVGPYTVTMWENLGKEGQTVVDRCDAFCLVARSCEEAESGSAEDPGLEIESLDLGTSNFEAGVPGASAYELFKKHNPDSELTEEEYAEAPVQAAGAALAMVEQLEEKEVEVKQAEQLRKQAEQGREASEQARATAEQGRVAAEQQRALAEQIKAIYRAHGCSGPSFEPIVAFADDAADPHHQNSDRALQPGEMVLLDVGGVYHDYCSDMTRTFFTAEPTEKQAFFMFFFRAAATMFSAMSMPKNLPSRLSETRDMRFPVPQPMSKREIGCPEPMRSATSRQLITPSLEMNILSHPSS